jgi:hypothetical protein
MQSWGVNSGGRLRALNSRGEPIAISATRTPPKGTRLQSLRGVGASTFGELMNTYRPLGGAAGGWLGVCAVGLFGGASTFGELVKTCRALVDAAGGGLGVCADGWLG